MGEMIHIYHTNDLHSHLEHWPRIQELLINRRAWHAAEQDEVFIFDIGDHMDRWHPYSDATRGKGNCELLNGAGYDAVTIGNNEGITLPYDDLDTMYETANFPVLAANLYEVGGSRPKWVKPYRIFTTKAGTRIAVIGLTAYFARFYEQLGWKLTDPLAELAKQLKELKGKTDLIVLLSHLGLQIDEKIAGQFPEIDVILGGHTHHILHEGKEMNGCFLGAAGKHGKYVGHIILEIELNTKQIFQKKAVLYDTNELDQAQDEEFKVEKLYESGKKLLGGEIAILPIGLESENFRVSPLPKLLCEALREWCDADCAFLNSGLLLDSLPKGLVTEYDLLKVCPHPINPCTIELSGAELETVLQATMNPEWPHRQLIGFGFRGTVIGKMVYSGIEIKNGVHGSQFWINKEKLLPSKTYKLAIPSMFTFGHFFGGIFRSKDLTYLLPEFMRDLLKWKLKKTF